VVLEQSEELIVLTADSHTLLLAICDVLRDVRAMGPSTLLSESRQAG